MSLNFDLGQLDDLFANIYARTADVDERAKLPINDITDLAELGLLVAVLADKNTSSLVGNFELLSRILKSMGRASLTVGRLYEGHVNAALLIQTYGDGNSAKILTEEAQAGRLLGVWNAERGSGVRMVTVDGGVLLSGCKVHCSGAGHIRRPVVTARDPNGQLWMILPDLKMPGVEIDNSIWRATGMRGTATATVNFDNMFVATAAIIGVPGDYYRSPLFAGGAWRVLAVQLGGLQRIIELHAERLAAGGRSEDPMCRARFAEAAANYECARLLVAQAGRRAENSVGDPLAIDAYVNMARAQFEKLAMVCIDAARRNIGLSSFIAPDPLDRCIRDLETYLRQPFIDTSRDAAAKWLIPRGGVFEG